MEILKGHLSPDTAYVVNDYPYGFRLRCKIRYWLEAHPKHGVRFLQQTTNPKRAGEYWNKPKASTYCAFGGCMILDDVGHVKWTGLGHYGDLKDALSFKEKYGEGIPPAAIAKLDEWIKAKTIYEGKIAAGTDWQQAGKETALELMQGRIETMKEQNNTNALLLA